MRIEQLDLSIMLSIKKKVFKKLLSKNMQFFNESHSGRLSQIINRDIKDFCGIITLELSTIVRGTVFCLISSALLLATNSTLLIVGVGPLGFVIYFGRKVARFLRHKKFELVKMNGKLNAYSGEVLRQIRTVKLFMAEKNEIEKFDILQAEIVKKSKELTKYSSGFFSIIELFVEILVIIGLGLGIYIHHFYPSFNLQDYSSNGIYLVYAGFGFRLVLSGYSEIQKAFGLYDGLNSIYSSPLTEDSSQSNLQKYSNLPSIQIKNLKFTYPSLSLPVLNNINMYIGPGNIIGIIGARGNGKTTLFNLITHLYTPMEGEILINHINIFNNKPSWARQQYGIVTQEGLLFTGTILENLQYPYKHKLQKIRKICEKVGILELIDSFPEGFNTKVGENGLSLSGGQRQRICIARALLKKPQILLLDEATSGLDSASEYKIQKILDSAVKSRKYTVLIITHRVSSLQFLADKIFLLLNGEIKAQGTYSELLNDPSFLSMTQF